MSKERVTRRKFIYRGGKAAIVGVAAIGSFVSSSVRLNFPQNELLGRQVEGFDAVVFENDKELEVGRSTVGFRSKLALSGFSKELIEGAKDKREDWGSAPSEFKNNLPEALKSYGMATEELIQKALGKNGAHLITGVGVSDQSPYGHRFVASRRIIEVSRDVDRDFSLSKKSNGTGWTYYEIETHEMGHNLDSRFVGNIYPWKTLLKVEYGKWLMLSETFDLTGSAAEVVKGKINTDFKVNLASEVAQRFLSGTLPDTLESPEDFENIKNLVNRLAARNGKSPDDLKFNKRVCRQFGDQLLRMMGSGQIHLKGELKEDYETKIEDALVEVYAEMFRVALFRPEGIDHNPKVLEGVKRILSAVRGEEVDLVKLRKEILDVSPQIMERYAYEKDTKALIAGEIVASPYEGSIKAQEDQQKQEDREVDQFLRGGKLPENIMLPPNQVEILQNYSTVLSEFINSQLNLQDSRVPLEYAFDNFDPQMHYWEIMKVQNAVTGIDHRTLIINLTKQRQVFLQPEQIKKIGEYTQVLQDFLSSNL